MTSIDRLLARAALGAALLLAAGILAAAPAEAKVKVTPKAAATAEKPAAASADEAAGSAVGAEAPAAVTTRTEKLPADAAVEGDEEGKPAEGEAGKKRKRGGVIVLEAIKVEGRIQKPNAFYILQRTSLNFSSLELKKSFLGGVERSVEGDPF